MHATQESENDSEPSSEHESDDSSENDAAEENYLESRVHAFFMAFSPVHVHTAAAVAQQYCDRGVDQLNLSLRRLHGKDLTDIDALEAGQLNLENSTVAQRDVVLTQHLPEGSRHAGSRQATCSEVNGLLGPNFRANEKQSPCCQRRRRCVLILLLVVLIACVALVFTMHMTCRCEYTLDVVVDRLSENLLHFDQHPCWSKSVDCHSVVSVVGCRGRWSDWTNCSMTCGNGTRSQTYYPHSVDLTVWDGSACPWKMGAMQQQDCNVDPCPPAGTISASLTLAGSVADLPVSFASAFVDDIATLLSVQKTQVNVDSIVDGSVIVQFSVVPSTDGTRVSPSALISVFSLPGVRIANTTITAGVVGISVQPDATNCMGHWTGMLHKTGFMTCTRMYS